MAKDLVIYKPKIDKIGATTLYKRKSGTYAAGKTRKYTKRKAAKGNIFAKAGIKGSKMSGEQRILGKTLPRMAWGAAKWAWRHPIASTAILMAPSIGKKLGASKKFSFPEFRQFDKRGRKII